MPLYLLFREKKRLGLAVVSALALAAGLYGGWLSVNQAPHPQTQPAEALSRLALPDVQGVSQPLAQWHGKVRVINFWATWCSPCLEEMPDFQQASQAYARHDVQFVGLAVDNVQAVKTFAERLGISYPLLMIGTLAPDVMRTLGNAQGGLPFTVILNRQGEIVAQHAGRLEAKALHALLDQTLGFTPPGVVTLTFSLSETR